MNGADYSSSTVLQGPCFFSGKERTIVRIEQRTKQDCLRCSVAMILSMDYDEVPDFVQESPKSWTSALRTWLGEQGLGLYRVTDDSPSSLLEQPLLAIGRGSTGDFHAVVEYRGVVDPSQRRNHFLDGAKYRFAFLPLSRETEEIE